MRRRAPPPAPTEEEATEEEDAVQQPKVAVDEFNSYWLSRVVFLRSLGAVYAVAFLVAVNQNGGLIGTQGLIPFPMTMERILESSGGDRWQAFLRAPSLLWFVDWSDHNMLLIEGAGLTLALCVAVRGAANMLVMAALWALYFSIVSIGSTWYGFGWESQLLEQGFLAVFAVPLLSLSQYPMDLPFPAAVRWGNRWLMFRLMLGAGLIKIRGDECWRDFSCMRYHYETQPVPNPLSSVFHAAPGWFHELEVAVNHVVELACPWLLLVPSSRCRNWGAAVQVVFQAILILSGNLSFLNWLTIVHALPCFDDGFLAWILPCADLRAARRAEAEHRKGMARLRRGSVGYVTAKLRSLTHVALVAGVAFLSIPVVQNLMSSSQAMNTSFDSFRLVNSYGAFGSITKKRYEIVLAGTRSEDPQNPLAEWRELEFKCKPGRVDRRPCWISPYHLRLDWLAWFAAFPGSSVQQHPWLVHLSYKLLLGDKTVGSLMAPSPFGDGEPPRFIRADWYSYRFDPTGRATWARVRVREYMPAISLDNQSVRRFLDAYGLRPAPE